METETSKINISFVDPKLNSYKAKRVVISDGKTIQEFKDVERINSEIPSSCSMRVIWTSGEYDTMEQIPLNLDSGKEYDFNFYCLDRTEVVEQTTPYILFEEKGADAKLEWEWNEKERKLTGIVNANQGKLVDVAVWVDTKLMQRPISATKSSLTTSSSLDWSVCFPPNVNLTGSFGGGSLFPGRFEHQFVQIADSLQVAGIRKANYKSHIIDDFHKEPFQCELTSIDGKIIKSEYYWPQYAIEKGFYQLKSKKLPIDFVPLPLPIKVELDKVGIYEYYPPMILDIQSFGFDILAEYYHSRAIVHSINHNKEKKNIKVFSSAQGDTKYSNGYFGVFPLPLEHTVKRIVYTDNAGNEKVLNEFEDYISNKHDKYLFVSVRIPLDSVNIELQYS